MPGRTRRRSLGWRASRVAREERLAACVASCTVESIDTRGGAMTSATCPAPRGRPLRRWRPRLSLPLLVGVITLGSFWSVTQARATPSTFSAVVAWGDNSAHELGIGGDLGPE